VRILCFSLGQAFSRYPTGEKAKVALQKQFADLDEQREETSQILVFLSELLELRSQQQEHAAVNAVLKGIRLLVRIPSARKRFLEIADLRFRLSKVRSR